jgi:hypothetical protein
MSVFSPLLGRTLEAIHACAREGDLQGLSQLLDLGIPVDLKGEV